MRSDPSFERVTGKRMISGASRVVKEYAKARVYVNDGLKSRSVFHTQRQFAHGCA